MIGKSLRVAVIAPCPFPYGRGTPTRILRTVEALARRGHEVHVVTYHLGEAVEPTNYHLHRIRDVKTYRKLSPGPTYQKLLVVDLLLALKLRQVLRTVPIDLIHAHHYEGLLVGLTAARSGRYPLIYDAHTLLVSELPYYNLSLTAGTKRRLGRLLDRHLPARADHVISVSDELRQRLIGEFDLPANAITVVGNGVEFSHFAEYPATASNPRRTLIFTGNLATYQGIDLLLGAFRRVLNQEPDIRLRIVSEASFAPYEALAQRLGVRAALDIQNGGYESLPGHFSAAAIALNPRIACDGTPLKLLNYMAAGKAIVSFAGSARVVADEETALVVADGDLDAFAAAIRRLLGDPVLAARLGAAAQQRARTELRWDHAAAQVETVYAALLSTPGQMGSGDGE